MPRRRGVLPGAGGLRGGFGRGRRIRGLIGFFGVLLFGFGFGGECRGGHFSSFILLLLAIVDDDIREEIGREKR